MSCRPHLIVILVLLAALIVCAVAEIRNMDTVGNVMKVKFSPGMEHVRARSSKKLLKFLLPFIAGMLSVKGLLFPIALKTLALISFLSIIMSASSLILTALINGLKDVVPIPHTTKHFHFKDVGAEDLPEAKNGTVPGSTPDYAYEYVPVKQS